MAKLFVLSLLLGALVGALVNCARGREVGLGLTEIATALCEKSLSEPTDRQAMLPPELRQRTSAMGVSAVCALEEVLAPFVQGLLRAQRSARAGLRGASVAGAEAAPCAPAP